MANITDYATLLAAVEGHLARGDLDSKIDLYIMEAEAEMNARLRVRRMLTAVTPTVSGVGVVTLPTGFGGWKRFSRVRDGVSSDLMLLTPESQHLLDRATAATATPQAVIPLGTTAQVWPYGDGSWSWSALYYQRVPNLNGTDTTNWVVANYPTAYFYGCLAAARDVSSVEDVARHAELFNRALDRIEQEDSLDASAATDAILTPNTSLFGRWGGRGYDVMQG